MVRAHLRAYHKASSDAQGKDEESLSTFTAHMAEHGGSWKIARFDYVILIALGRFDAFTDVTAG